MSSFAIVVKKKKSLLCLIANLVIYIGFAILDGPVWCRDSESYVSMNPMREPLYCSFLWLMRKLFGDPTFSFTAADKYGIGAEGVFRGLSGMMVNGWDLTDRIGGKVPSTLPFYMMSVIVIQSAVAAMVAWYLVRFCWRTARGWSLRCAILSAVFANLIMWGIEILNRFGAKRGSTYEQSIMTEGLGISFYILFMIFLLQYLTSLDHNRTNRRAVDGKDLWQPTKGSAKFLRCTCFMMALCILLHKQLVVTAVIFLISCFAVDIMTDRRFRRYQRMSRIDSCSASVGNVSGQSDTTRKTCKTGYFLHMFGTHLLVLLLTLGSVYLLEHAYHLAVQGRWSNHTGSADKIDSTLLYTADRGDAALFEDDSLRNLFLQIEDEMEEKHLRFIDVPENADWVLLCSHYADSYDVIGFEILDPLVQQYVMAEFPEIEPGSMDESMMEDKVCRNLMGVLVHQDPQRLLRLWWGNFRKGFVNTVLRVSPLFNWISLILWLGYVCLIAVLLRQDRSRRKTWGPGMTVVPISFGLLVVLGTTVNAAVVGAVIFPQTRYMIYNMALFYVSGFLMLEAITVSINRSGEKYNTESDPQVA